MNAFLTIKTGAKGRICNFLCLLFETELIPFSRGSSKAFADGLCQRIEQLESLLQQQGSLTVPQLSENINENGDGSAAKTYNALGKLPVQSDEPPPYNNEAVQVYEVVHHVWNGEQKEPEPDSSTLVRKLVPCPVRFDMASGRKVFNVSPRANY
jgi:hypothetical protein